MTTSSDDGEFEQDLDPADKPAAGDDAAGDRTTTAPEPGNVVHIDEIIAAADEKDGQRRAEGKMTLGRYHDISRQIADGHDPQLSATEKAQYDETHESMKKLGRNLSKSIVGPNSDLVKSLMAPYANINKKLADSIAQNTGIQNAFKQSTKSIVDFQSMIKPPAYEIPKLYDPPSSLVRPEIPVVPDYSKLFDNSEQLKSIEKANEERNKREEADRQVAATHLEATQHMVAAMTAQATASDKMSKHQKRMNWWILSATAAGIITAIVIKIVGG